MFRRAALAVATAAAIVLLPSAAIGATYPAPGTTMTIGSPTATVGVPFTVQIPGPQGSSATLRITTPGSVSPGDVDIAGVKELSKTIQASGVADFTVTLNAPGTYTLTGLVDGVVLDTQTVTARAAGGSGSASGDPADSLSETGFSGLPLALGAGVLLLAGGAAVVAARRRQRQDTDA